HTPKHGLHTLGSRSSPRLEHRPPRPIQPRPQRHLTWAWHLPNERATLNRPLLARRAQTPNPGRRPRAGQKPTMAKVQFGSGVAYISGRIAGTVHARNKGGSYIRRFSVPINPATGFQQGV